MIDFDYKITNPFILSLIAELSGGEDLKWVVNDFAISISESILQYTNVLLSGIAATLYGSSCAINCIKVILYRKFYAVIRSLKTETNYMRFRFHGQQQFHMVFNLPSISAELDKNI